MGKNKLMAELGLMKDAAEKLLKTYHQRAPFVKMLSEAVARRADDSGKIRTIGGRLCHLIFGSRMVLVSRNHCHTQMHSGSMDRGLNVLLHTKHLTN